MTVSAGQNETSKKHKPQFSFRKANRSISKRKKKTTQENKTARKTLTTPTPENPDTAFPDNPDSPTTPTPAFPDNPDNTDPRRQQGKVTR
jgi:hypothetical protein